MILCALSLMIIGADVGKSSNVIQNEKTVIFIDNDSPASLSAISAFSGFDGIMLIVTNDVNFSFKELKTGYTPIVFMAPSQLALEPDRYYTYVPYRQKGQLKAKFHPKHLFNPVKLC